MGAEPPPGRCRMMNQGKPPIIRSRIVTMLVFYVIVVPLEIYMGGAAGAVIRDVGTILRYWWIGVFAILVLPWVIESCKRWINPPLSRRFRHPNTVPAPLLYGVDLPHYGPPWVDRLT